MSLNLQYVHCIATSLASSAFESIVLRLSCPLLCTEPSVVAVLLLSVRVVGMGEKYDVKKFDTTKMSGAELKELGIEGARKPPGSNVGPGSTLHQQGGQGLGKAGRYPLILAGVAGVVGIATFYYYRSLGVQEIPGKSNQALTSDHPATAKAPSERAFGSFTCVGVIV